MSEHIVPTAKFRWVATEDTHSQPVAETVYYGQHTYFKLQQWWQDTRLTIQAKVGIGEWRDVEVEDV